MASNELIIDDDYCKAAEDYIVRQGNEIDQIIVLYISILQLLKNKGIVSGDVASALSVYIDYVEKLKKQIGNISNSTKTKVESFLKRVDSEDKYLF